MYMLVEVLMSKQRFTFSDGLLNNVFHILLKMWHIIVWFGPNCFGKSTTSFRIYDMIKKYVVNR